MKNALLGYIQYTIINKVLEKYQTKKLAMNSTALIHSSSSTLIWLFGSPKWLIYNTGGYMLFDMLYLIRNREKNLLHGAFIYHHLATLYYMSLSPIIYNWFNLTGVAELSNIPSYIVYYYLKTDPNGSSVVSWKLVQKVWYGFFRLFVLTIMTYNEVKDPSRFKKLLPSIPLYILTLVWGSAILKQ
jgi:hypothetical protein